MKNFYVLQPSIAQKGPLDRLVPRGLPKQSLLPKQLYLANLIRFRNRELILGISINPQENINAQKLNINVNNNNNRIKKARRRAVDLLAGTVDRIAAVKEARRAVTPARVDEVRQVQEAEVTTGPETMGASRTRMRKTGRSRASRTPRSGL